MVRSRICRRVSVNADSMESRPPKGKGVLSIRITGPQLRFGVFCCCKQSSKRRRFFSAQQPDGLTGCAWCLKPRCRSPKRVGGSLGGGLHTTTASWKRHPDTASRAIKAWVESAFAGKQRRAASAPGRTLAGTNWMGCVVEKPQRGDAGNLPLDRVAAG